MKSIWSVCYQAGLTDAKDLHVLRKEEEEVLLLHLNMSMQKYSHFKYSLCTKPTFWVLKNKAFHINGFQILIFTHKKERMAMLHDGHDIKCYFNYNWLEIKWKINFQLINFAIEYQNLSPICFFEGYWANKPRVRRVYDQDLAKSRY